MELSCGLHRSRNRIQLTPGVITRLPQCIDARRDVTHNLGIDVGTASIGRSVVELGDQQARIVIAGVRMFDALETDKEGALHMSRLRPPELHPRTRFDAISPEDEDRGVVARSGDAPKVPPHTLHSRSARARASETTASVVVSLSFFPGSAP